jgi:hypothetical protein
MLTLVTFAPYIIASISLVVDTTSDCDGFPNADSTPEEVLTLRAAIEIANASPGPDEITFSVEGVIRPCTALPAVSDHSGGTRIDGMGRIMLDGELLDDGENGISIASAHNEILNLSIVNFPGHGIKIAGPFAQFNIIRGCMIGNDGWTDLGNKLDAISIVEQAAYNTIGGTGANAANVLAGNERFGILLHGGAHSNLISGNRVGISMQGSALLNFGGLYDCGVAICTRGGIGIRIVDAPKNVIGTSEPGGGNIISANHAVAIHVIGKSAHSTIIQGNHFVTDLEDTQYLPERYRSAAIMIHGADFNLIGGIAPGSGNYIDGYWRDYCVIIEGSHNQVQGNILTPSPIPFEVAPVNAAIDIDGFQNLVGGYESGAGNSVSGRNGFGVRVWREAQGNQVRGNRIYDNVLKPIHVPYLGKLGQPLIETLYPVTGTAPPCGEVDLFVSGGDDCEDFLGAVPVDACGRFTSGIDLAPYAGMNLTATATDADGNTSEVTFPVPISAPGHLKDARLAKDLSCACEYSTHSADQNADNLIGLSELLRVFQLFNLGEFHCDAAGEDGYTPGAGDRICRPHSSDYSPQDWQISVSELLRTIQYYNSGGYYYCPAEVPPTEDGYCPAGA